MGSYTLNINTGVTGAENIERVTTATDRQAAATKRVDQAIKDYTAANDKLQLKMLEIQRAELALEKVREQHRMQIERLAASNTKAAASQEALNSAVQHTVTDVQAASASIRAMEGHLPIRAVEQFTTKMLGMGGAFRAVFPIVGAVALLETMEALGEKVGLQLNVWREINEAERQSTEELRRAGREYDTLLDKIKRLQEEERRRVLITRSPRNGAILADQAEAFDKTFDAETRDRQKIALLERELAAVRKVTHLGVYDSISSDDARFAVLAGMDSTDLSDRNLPSAFAIEKGKKLLAPLEKELSVARLQLDADIQEAKKEGARADEEIERKREEAARKVAAIEERILGIRKQAAEAAMQAYFGTSLEGRAAYDQVRLQFEANETARKYPSRAAEIRGYYAVQGAFTAGEYQDAIARRNAEELYGLEDVGRTASDRFTQNMQKTGADAWKVLDELIYRTPTAPTPPPGYRTGAQELRDIRDSERRYLAIARVSGQLAGTSQRDQIDSQYASRLRFADQEYQAELRIADLKKTDAERELARQDALDQKKQKIFDAELERQQAILEMTLRQKEQFERGVVDLVHAAASGGLGSYLRRRLESIGDEILAKAAGKIFDKISAQTQGVSIADVIGSAAKDQVNSTNDNTRATDDNTKAVRDLTATLAATGVGGAGTGVISFPTAGGPGIFGFPDASSAIMYGFPGTGGISLPGSGGTRAFGISKGVSTAACYAAAGFLGYEGVTSLTKGGGRNIAGGVGELAGAAALLDPEPVSKAILTGVAAIAGVVSSLFGDPKASRQREITNRLSFGRYIDPVSMNAVMSAAGGYVDYDRFGGIRDSDLSPFPITQSGYFDWENRDVVPGRTLSPYGGGARPQVVVQIHALDAKSVIDRHQDIGDAVVMAIDRGHTALQEKLGGF